MTTLQAMLNTRTHRDLELIARAHKLPFTRRVPKAQGLASLAATLHAGAYQKAFATLTDEHIAALHALVAAGGWLPLPLFTHYFGAIRPYKPWRADFAPRHPWRYPISVAERLYHLGFISLRDGEMVGLIDEARALLPPLPRAQPVVTSISGAHAGTPLRGSRPGVGGHPYVPPHETYGRMSPRLDLLRDVAALLGTLLHEDAPPLHGRWLSLRVMQAVNQRLYIKEDLAAVRSELQSRRLRWLHYLAQVGGLLWVCQIEGEFDPLNHRIASGLSTECGMKKRAT